MYTAAHALQIVCSNCQSSGGGDGLTGWATLALAVVTTLLACGTFLAVRQGKIATQAAVDEVKATDALARQGSEQMRRSYLPLVLPVAVESNIGHSGERVNATIIVRIHNVGNGPALNLGLDVIWPDGVSRRVNRLDARRPAVKAGSADQLAVRYDQEIPSSFTALLSFADSFRVQYRASCLSNGDQISELASTPSTATATSWKGSSANSRVGLAGPLRRCSGSDRRLEL